jgi:hypothetical protein
MGYSDVMPLEKDGFAWARSATPAETRAELCAVLTDKTGEATDNGSRRGASVYALRNVLEIPAVRSLVCSSCLREWVEPILGPEAFPVRGIFFDKIPEANWVVPWHQDLSIAVQARKELPGWGPWSVKAGIPHVQPPISLMEGMVTTRIHLDDCGPENGPLMVLPGTHRLGRLNTAETADLVAARTPTVCTASMGDILLMRPLLLHASGRATTPGHRRILHIEWATDPLPDGIDWWRT